MSHKVCFDLNSNANEGHESPKAADIVYNDSDKGNMENISAENQRSKSKFYHRYTPEQIRELEAVFAECQHPNKKQRTELGENIGIDPMHVKFWFQNKLTKVKIRSEHDDNMHLHVENEKLQAENEKYKEAIKNSFCDVCRVKIGLAKVSPQALYLLSENDRLKREKARMLDGMATIVAQYMGKSTSIATTSCFPMPNSKDNEK